MSVRPPRERSLGSATRRDFLKLAGATAALSGLAGIRALPAAARSALEADEAPVFFSASQREVLVQVVERVVDSGRAAAPRVRETRAVPTIEALCASLDPALTGPLPTLLRLVEWGPFVFDFEFARFTRLDDAAQDRSLRGWMTSRFALRRIGFQALRNLSFLGWYAQEETWPLVGYAGPLLRRPGATS